MRFAIALLVFLPGLGNVYSQEGGWLLESEFHAGRMINHTRKLTFEPPARTIGLGLNFVYQTYGTKYWHKMQRFPALGLALIHDDLGDRNLLGSATSILPNVSIKLFNLGNLSSHLNFGTGVAYLSEPFDLIQNPKNNAIGSNWNNITRFRLEFFYPITSKLAVSAAGQLNHYSNGSVQLPNYGMNLPSASLGLRWNPNPKQRKLDFDSISSKPSRIFGLTINAGMAFTEALAPGGPKYPIYQGHVGLVYRLSKVNQLMLGMEYEYVSSSFYFSLASTEARTDQEAQKLATRYMFFVGDEFFFWPFSIALLAGGYFGGKPYQAGDSIYTKLSSRYYFTPFGKPKTRMYCAVHLKAHKATAEYISFGFGALL